MGGGASIREAPPLWRAVRESCPSNSVTEPPRGRGSEKIASSAWLHCHPVMFPCLPCQPSSSSDSKWGTESLGQEPPVEHPRTQPSRLRLRGRLVQSLLPWSFRLSGSHPCCTTDHLTWCPGSRAEARYHSLTMQCQLATATLLLCSYNHVGQGTPGHERKRTSRSRCCQNTQLKKWFNGGNYVQQPATSCVAERVVERKYP